MKRKRDVTMCIKRFDERCNLIKETIKGMAINSFCPNPNGQGIYYIIPKSKENNHALRMLKSMCYGVMKLYIANEGTHFGHQPTNAENWWVNFDLVYNY